MAAPLDTSEAEDFLRSRCIGYTRDPGGFIIARGNLDLSGWHAGKLPDLRSVTVTGNFFCNNSALETLEGAPRRVYGHFACAYNALASLEGAPEKLSGYMLCTDNPALSDFESLPKGCMKLISDHGEFPGWDAIPEELKISAETRRAHDEHARWLAAGMPIKAPLKIMKPLQIRKKHAP